MAAAEEPPEGYLDDEGYLDEPPPLDAIGLPLPHDLQAEESLIGAWILSEQARADTVGMCGPEDFYKPAHGHIADAIAYLTAEESPIDVAILANRMRAVGTLSFIGGPSVLAQIMGSTPAISNARRYAEIVAEMASRRRLIHQATDVLEAARAGDVNGALSMAEAMGRSSLNGQHDSWEPIDLGPVMSGEIVPTLPNLLARTDGELMLYLGKIHAFNAEPEAGKSWLALHACAQTMTHEQLDVLYIDYEDDERDVTSRLSLMGVATEVILERFHYVRPTDPITAQSRARLIALADERDVALCVIDGVTEMLHSNGWTVGGSSANDDAAAMYESLPRPIAATGAAVLLIDHVVKDKESQGRWAIGAQHKMAGITGASYSVEAVEPFGEGRVGRSKITVQKDRPGMVRKYAGGGKVVGMFTLASMADGSGVTTTIVPPATDADGSFRPTHIMERVCQIIDQLRSTGVNATSTNITKDAGTAKSTVITALSILTTEGFLETTSGTRGAVYYSVAVPYREITDPLSDSYSPMRSDAEIHSYSDD